MCNRIITWGKFRDIISNKIVYMFNTHFDHIGNTARINSARLLLNRLNEIPENSYIILTGDFNSYPSSETYKILTSSTGSSLKLFDTFEISGRTHMGPEGTFNGFDKVEFIDQPIDYIFVSGNFDVLSHSTLNNKFEGLYPSDHFPVVTTLQFNELSTIADQ